MGHAAAIDPRHALAVGKGNPHPALGGRGERGNGPGAPAVRALLGPTGLLALVRNTYVNYLLDRAMRGREFALLGRVAAGVALREAAPHAGAAHLGGLCDLLLEDFAALASGAPPQAGT